MNFTGRRVCLFLGLVSLVLGGSAALGQSDPANSFKLEISLQSTQIHSSDTSLVIRIEFSNPTNHTVWVYNETDLEILNNKGMDVAPMALGVGTRPNTGFELGEGSQAGFRSHSKFANTWSKRLQPGVLMPGNYKVRVFRGDARSHTQIYSNAVTLTVLP